MSPGVSGGVVTGQQVGIAAAIPVADIDHTADKAGGSALDASEGARIVEGRPRLPVQSVDRG